jgi:hypothetical protein
LRAIQSRKAHNGLLCIVLSGHGYLSIIASPFNLPQSEIIMFMVSLSEVEGLFLLSFGLVQDKLISTTIRTIPNFILCNIADYRFFYANFYFI